jgi:hypothetical protein
MIDISKAKVGDCVYVKLSIQNAPVFGDIIKVLEKENAIEIRTSLWGHRVVIAENAYWDEKLAKKGKIVKLQNNYTQWAQEYLQDEKAETIDRVDPVHHRQPEESEAKGENSGASSISKSVKRKQKIVRKSSKARRKSKRSRKTGNTKK